MHVFVTGARGFSGNQIVQAFVGAGHRVTAHVGRAEKNTAGEQQAFQTISGDLAEGIDIPSGVDLVVHTAAVSPAPGLQVSTDQYVRSNIRTTQNIAEAASRSGVKKLVYFSSISVNGQVNDDVLNEDTPIISPDMYGVSKHFGELCLAEHPFASVSLRLPGVLGPGAARNWLSSMVSDSRHDKTVKFFNGDAEYNNAVHIDDIINLLFKIYESPITGHDVVVLGAAEHIIVRDMVSLIVNAGGNKASMEEIAPLRKPFLLSSTKAQLRYGYNPQQMLEMLKKFVSENGLNNSLS